MGIPLSTRMKYMMPTLRVGRRYAALGEPAAAACGGGKIEIAQGLTRNAHDALVYNEEYKNC